MESKDTDGNEATLPKSSSSGHVLIVEAPEEAGKHEVETKRHRRNLSEDRFSDRGSDVSSLGGERDLSAERDARAYDLEQMDADLTELDLNHGRFEEIPAALARFTQMQSLCMRQNLLTAITNLTAPSMIETLTQVDLYDNQIDVINGLDALINLEHLDLSYNRIRRIENLGSLTKLKVLYLVHNKIRRIENLDNNLALELLEIGDNRLRKIENVNHLKHLRQLYLGKNKIANIENIDALCSLTCLSLPGNRLTQLKNLDCLPQLEELYVSDNGLRCLSGLDKLTNLTMLDIANNQIEHLANLKHLQNLEDLWANDNAFADWHEVDSELAPLQSLRTIYLERNPLYTQNVGAYRRKLLLALPQVTQIDALLCLQERVQHTDDGSK